MGWLSVLIFSDLCFLRSGLVVCFESNEFAFISPTPYGGSEHGSTLSSRTWIISKLLAEFHRWGIPFPASAREAILGWLLFLIPSQPLPSTSTEHVSMHNSLTQINAIINTLFMSML